MMPRHLEFLRLRVARAQAKIQIASVDKFRVQFDKIKYKNMNVRRI